MTEHYPYGCARIGDWPTGDYMFMLMLASWSPDPTTQIFVDDIAVDEIGVAGYSRQTLTGASFVDDPSFTWSAYDANNPIFSGMASGEMAGWLVTYKDEGVDTSSPLLFAHAFNSNFDTADIVGIPISSLGLARIYT